MKSVNIGNLAVRPLPREIVGKVSCTHCRVRPARWEINDWSYGCSFCFLYGMDMLKEQQEALVAMVEGVEQNIGEVFPRVDGVLAREEDADRIAMGIVMAQRFELARGLR